MNFLSTNGNDLCTLPWNDIIGYAPPNVAPVLIKACNTQTANCETKPSCDASTPVCSTCCDFVNNLPGSDEFKQAGNDYCRSLNKDAEWGAECDADKNEDGTDKAVCKPAGESEWKKEIAAIVVAKVEAKMKDLKTWKTTVDRCTLDEDGKCKTYATKDDNNKTMNMANLAVGLSLLCLVFLIIFLFVKKK